MITGQREPPFHIGVVESRDDPLKIGRVRVRVVGLHTHDKTILPTEDLPWCYCIQPINSAAISGIGQAPVGPIEGTWVAVQYMDQDKQNPFVVGTLPGIAHQQTFFNNAPSQGGNYEVKPDGAVIAPWVDYGGAPIGDGKFNPAGTYQTSEAMVQKIKQHESFRSKPYDDGAGVWTIGYGTTYIDGAKVTKNTPEISEGRALELFKNDLAVVENSVKSAVTVPVTQSMFDAMVSLSYNIGGGAFRKSSVVRELNARNYEKAGDHFRDWKYAGGKVMAGLESRRNDERSWFMREGVGGDSADAAALIESLAAPGAQRLVAVGESPSVQPTYPISRVLDFGSAAGMTLDPEAKAAIVASGAVKILSKEEYVANIVTDPPIYTSTGGGGGGGGSGGGTSRTRKVTVEVSHPDVIKFSNLEEFIAKPFSENNPHWVTPNAHPIPYSGDGAQVRFLKGELYSVYPGVQLVPVRTYAKGGEARLRSPYVDSRAAFALNSLGMTIEVSDSETADKQNSTRIVTDYFDDLKPALKGGSSIFGTYNDFENKQSEIPWYGVYAQSNYYERNVESGVAKLRIKSVEYRIGSGSMGIPGFPCDEYTKVVADKLVILLKFGNIKLEEYNPLEFYNVLSSKTLAEDAWVEIVIPIDLDWGQENSGGGGGGGTAPGIPQLPTLFSGKEPPKTPEDTVDFAAQVVGNTTAAPVNGKQFAATVAAAAIMGPDAYKKSRFSIMLNAGNPLAAADALGDLQTYIDLKLDPDEEKALEEAKKLHAALAPFKETFLQGGYLDEFGEYKDTPQSIDAMQSQPGYVARPQFLPNEPVGFQDPHKQYPKPNNKDEPDTSRIQRQERARATQQFKKEQSRHKEVIQANGAGSWEQPTSGYNTRYPYNHATTTESGHVFEFDDTPGSERINMYHRTGTFFEIDNAGTRVRRTVGDDYTILERDGKVHIVGNADVTIGGARRVRVENTFDLEVHGATTINIFNDVNLRVSGDVRAKVSGGLHASVVGDTNVAAMGTMQLRSNGNMFLNTEGRLIVNAKGNIEMNTSGEFVSKSAGATKIGAGGQVSIDGTATYIQSGGASSGGATVPPFKLEKDLVFKPKKVVLPPLHPHSRDQEAAAVFETPDEGTDTEINAWKKKRLDEGTATALDFAKEPAKPEGDDVESPAAKGSGGASVQVEVPTNREFRGDDKISKYFTLADVTHNYSRKLTDRFGNTAQEKFKALSNLATNVLDIIKAKYPSMVITSGLRDFIPPGGAKKSAHLTGHAVDIQFPGLDRKGHQRRATELSQLFEYDQMLLEYTTNGNGWIHISLKPNPRGQAFTMYNHKKVAGSDGKFIVVV